MRIVIAGDHGGFEIKQRIKAELEKRGIEVVDVGAHEYDATDNYADFVVPVVEAVLGGDDVIGVFVCRTGTGPAIFANRHKGIRAAVCHRVEYARLSREHQNANVLCLGADFTSFEDIIKIVETFIGTGFEGGRHAERIAVFD